MQCFYRFSIALGMLVLLLMSGMVHADNKGIKRKTGRDFSQSPRKALVIGNGEYAVGRLKNPANDARDMARVLNDLGFDVALKLNLDRKGMFQAIREFGDQLGKNAVGLFYFSGHGLRVNSRNYLVPVGADVKRPDEVQFEAVPADLVLSKMHSSDNPLNLVVLDACRNNPWARSWHKGPGEMGLGSMSPPTGTLIFYAASPGGVAEDGDGSNSPFTRSLKTRITQPDLNLLNLVTAVAGDVVDETGGAQNPWMEGMVLGKFYFSTEQPGPGTLEIVLKPEVPGAWVRINGRDYGNQRQFTIQDQGRYRIEIGADGYRTHRKTEVLGPGMKKTVTARLEKVEPAVVPEPEPVTPTPSVSDTPKPGDILKGPLGMEFAWVPAGSFMMGSPPDEPDRDDDEKQHKVRLTRGFWMQTTEVTQGQWKAIMGSNPSYFDECGEDCPVEQVSWHDAKEFIKKLNRQEGGNRYRLPTEAEWEYACRAGTTTLFFFGNCLSTNQANYHGNYPYEGCAKGTYRGKTIPVGSLNQPNTWGLHDMHGNVWEWCQDWYGDYPSGSVTDPVGPSSGSPRVLRGGSWYGTAAHCRSANRDSNSPGNRGLNLGFRLSRTP